MAKKKFSRYRFHEIVQKETCPHYLRLVTDYALLRGQCPFCKGYFKYDVSTGELKLIKVNK